jgi:ribosome-associated toxin RatA of RatAB toxin-antitoxin module
MDLPPRKVWAVVSDCAHYREHLPRIAASELLKRDGNLQTCRVTVQMPFPLANLTSVTAAVLEENESGMLRRWKLVSGDFKANEGSWEVKPLERGASSLVVYTIHAEPNGGVPAWLRESAQKKALPELFERVKAEARRLP